MVRTERCTTLSDSELESAFLYWWQILMPDLPLPEREVELIPNRKFKCDFVWRDARVVTEVDGGTHAPGAGRHNTSKDRWKINKLVELGWHVLRYSGDMIRETPEDVIEQVARMVRKEV